MFGDWTDYLQRSDEPRPDYGGVRPGQVVRVTRNSLTKRRYCELAAREHADDLPRTVNTVAELLDDIVRRPIVADVPLCSLLSGGLD